MAVANDHIYSGSYDCTVRSWDIDDIKGRIAIRERLKLEEDYSNKAEVYKSYLDNKKKKKKGKKSSGKSKSKSPKKR